MVRETQDKRIILVREGSLRPVDELFLNYSLGGEGYSARLVQALRNAGRRLSVRASVSSLDGSGPHAGGVPPLL
jgi:hypothetical protein